MSLCFKGKRKKKEKRKGKRKKLFLFFLFADYKSLHLIVIVDLVSTSVKSVTNFILYCIILYYTILYYITFIMIVKYYKN